MIHIAVLTAFLFAAAPAAPKPPAAPKAPHPPRSYHFDFVVPEIPEIPEIPEVPDLEELGELPGFILPELFAFNDSPRIAGEDEDQDGEEVQDGGVRIYRMKRDRLVLPRLRQLDGDFADERDATGQAKGKGSAMLPVKGPVTFQLRAQGGDLEVVATDKQQVSISLSEAPADEVALYAFGDRIEPSFRGRRLLRRGKLRVELPRGSRLDVSSMSGDISAEKIGEVRVRTMSGDVKLSSVTKSDVQSISGDVRIDGASGPVRLHLVSGRATVLTSGAAPQVEFQSASGSLEWSGLCAKDCHVSAETVSGDLRLAVDPKSSFELSYTSHSGELRDEANLTVKHAPRRRHGMSGGWLEATFGKGEGSIEADAFSGNLVVTKK